MSNELLIMLAGRLKNYNAMICYESCDLKTVLLVYQELIMILTIDRYYSYASTSVNAYCTSTAIPQGYSDIIMIYG